MAMTFDELVQVLRDNLAGATITMDYDGDWIMSKIPLRDEDIPEGKDFDDWYAEHGLARSHDMTFPDTVRDARELLASALALAVGLNFERE